MDKITHILKEGNFISIEINNTKKRFMQIFSKMEFVSSYGVIINLTKTTRTKKISISTSSYLYNGNDEDFNNYINQRSKIYSQKEVSKSENVFLEEYEYLLKHNTNKEIKIDSVSLWKNKEVMKIIDECKTRTVLLFGFNSDSEILVNAIEAMENGFVPIVVSDGVSCPSERRHFSSLEVISRFSYILDSRDILEIMENEAK